jgi:hypothetical protein
MSDRHILRTLVRGAYDTQKLRIMMGNRIVAQFKAKLGQEPGEPEEELDAQEKKILADLRTHYRRITDGILRFPTQKRFKGTELISSYTELCLVSQYLDLEQHEDQHFRRLGMILNDFPIWSTWLIGVKGCGPAMAGVLISEIDIWKAAYPSSLWRYAGLAVEADGRGTSRRKEHLVNVTYTNREGEEAERKSITFNPFLKTKLYVLASSFLRAGDHTYSALYREYKHRLESAERWQAATKLHRHNAASRYMLKRFLADLYNHWRPLEGLSVAPEYQEAKLGHAHRAA